MKHLIWISSNLLDSSTSYIWSDSSTLGRRSHGHCICASWVCSVRGGEFREVKRGGVAKSSRQLAAWMFRFCRSADTLRAVRMLNSVRCCSVSSYTMCWIIWNLLMSGNVQKNPFSSTCISFFFFVKHLPLIISLCFFFHFYVFLIFEIFSKPIKWNDIRKRADKFI